MRVVDKVNGDDPAKDARCLKRGDVVVVCRDGHPWSQLELDNPEWRIVKVPGMSLEEGELLTARPFVLPGLGDTTKRRAQSLDLDSAVGPLKALLDDPKGQFAVVPRAAVQALVRLKSGVSEAERPRLR